MRLKLGFLLCVLIIFTFPSSLLAQEPATLQTKKNVVKNFKANLNDYSPFGSNCDLKGKGDANCDGAVNDFDLSVWEVEFSAVNSPMRSDFNNDGAVNLVDFGIWRGTVYPQKVSLLPDNCQNSIVKLFMTLQARLNCYIAKTQIAFQQFNNSTIQQFLPLVNAQEPQTSPAINASQSFSSASGNSAILNSLSGGDTQEVKFDPEGNPQSSLIFDANGLSLAAASFLESGSVIISTQDSGVQINITKTAAGPIIENFKNPDGSLLAIKTWPTQESYERNDPPQAVTLPGKDSNSFHTLNIQPNEGSLLQELDKSGSVINLSSFTANGLYGSINMQSKSTVQSLSRTGITTLKLENNLGGQTVYSLIDGAILNILQTDSKKNYWIATPQGSYETWELIAVTESDEVRTTVPNPIKAINSNSPSPLDLIKTWNYYLTAAKTSDPAIDFSTGFNSNLPALSRQVTAANEYYKIAQTPAPPDVLGIVKEAYAETTRTPSTDPQKSDIVNGYQTVVGSYTSDDGQRTVMTVATYGPIGSAAAQNQIASSQTVISATTEIPSLAGKDPASAAQSLAAISGTRAVDGSGTPLGTNTLATMPGTLPAEAAAQPAAQAQPDNPLPGPVGDWKTNQQGDKPGTEANQVRAAAAKAAGDKAQETEGSAEVKAGVSRSEYSKAFDSAYQEKFGRSITFDGLAMEERNLNSNYAYVQTFVSSTIPGVTSADGLVNGNIWNSPEAIQARQQAIDSLKAQGVQVNFTVKDFDTSPPGQYAPGTKTTSDAAPPGTTAQPPGSIPPPPPGTSLPPNLGAPGGPQSVSGTFNNLQTSTTRGADGFWTTEIKDETGKTVATHHFGYDKNGKDGATSLVEFWDKADGTRTTVRDGVMTEVEGKTATGQQFSIDLAANTFSIPAGMTAAEATSFVQQQLAERAYSQGFKEGDMVASWSVSDDGSATQGTSRLQGMSTCFLAGTLISTPKGPAAIETLKPEDKVYSFNEKTGQKEVSDFDKLDINFVDEYLIINGRIHTTVYHPFYVITPPPSSVNWIPAFAGMTTVRADQLKIGDILPTEEGKYVPVYSVEKIKAPKTTVYNLMEVTPNNNFFAEGILVHNYGGPENFDSNSLNEISSETIDTTSWSGDGYGGNEVSSDTGSISNDNFNNDPNTGGDANTAGADSSGW